jgi:predicted dehydrogenase
MAERVRIGVVGAGLIAQCEHIPNLIGLGEKFALVAVCDPSKTVRDFVADRFGVSVFPDSDALFGEALDAVIIASPDFTHVPETLKALSKGLHVFCEKPLCYGTAEANEIIQARDRVGVVVQVGYMKRHDPSYEACLELLPETPETLRFVSVEVTDPDAWPFLEQHPHKLADDLPEQLIRAGGVAKGSQIHHALGAEVPPAIAKGFAEAYCSSLVHDVNIVHGLLDRLGVPDGEVVGAEIFSGGSSALAAVRLLGGQAALQMAFVAVPKLASYRERILLAFDDRAIELDFPSPYLNHQPTRLLMYESAKAGFETREIRSGFGEAFIRELEAFWSAIVTGEPVRNAVEHARRDQALLIALARQAAGIAPTVRPHASASMSSQTVRHEAVT